MRTRTLHRGRATPVLRSEIPRITPEDPPASPPLPPAAPRRAGRAGPSPRTRHRSDSAQPLRPTCPPCIPGSCDESLMTPAKVSWATCRSTLMPSRSASTGQRPTAPAPGRRPRYPPPRTTRAALPPSLKWSSTACAASRPSTPPLSRPSYRGWRPPFPRHSPGQAPWLPGPRRSRPGPGTAPLPAWPPRPLSTVFRSLALETPDRGLGPHGVRFHAPVRAPRLPARGRGGWPHHRHWRTQLPPRRCL